MEKFGIGIQKEKIEGTNLQRRVAYVISYGEEILCSPENIVRSGDMMDYIASKVNREHPYLNLKFLSPDYGVCNTVLKTIGGVEPYLEIKIPVDHKIELILAEEEEEFFEQKMKIAQDYFKNLNQALETMLASVLVSVEEK